MPSLVDATAKASNLPVTQYVTNGSNVMGSTDYVVTYKLESEGQTGIYEGLLDEFSRATLAPRA
jgi:hypothetical protein